MKETGTAQTEFTNEVKEVSDPKALFTGVAVVLGVILAITLNIWYPPLANATQWLFGS